MFLQQHFHAFFSLQPKLWSRVSQLWSRLNMHVAVQKVSNVFFQPYTTLTHLAPKLTHLAMRIQTAIKTNCTWSDLTLNSKTRQPPSNVTVGTLHPPEGTGVGWVPWEKNVELGTRESGRRTSGILNVFLERLFLFGRWTSGRVRNIQTFLLTFFIFRLVHFLVTCIIADRQALCSSLLLHFFRVLMGCNSSISPCLCNSIFMNFSHFWSILYTIIHQSKNGALHFACCVCCEVIDLPNCFCYFSPAILIIPQFTKSTEWPASQTQIPKLALP